MLRSMGRSARIVLLAGVVAVLLIDTASAAGGQQRFFSITATGSGQFTQDFGEDRHKPDTRGFGTDGKTTVSWQWTIKSVGRLNGDSVNVAAAEVRRRVNVQSSTIEYDNYTGSLREEPWCRDSSFGIATDDGSYLLQNEADRGSWVRLPNARASSIDSSSFTTTLPSVPDTCAFHEVPEGLDFYDYANVDIARGAFNPKFDASYSKSFQDSANELHDQCCPQTTHTFQGSSTLQVNAKKIPERRAERRQKSYRKEDPFAERTDEGLS
jgi:hypothetical protein